MISLKFFLPPSFCLHRLWYRANFIFSLPNICFGTLPIPVRFVLLDRRAPMVIDDTILKPYVTAIDSDDPEGQLLRLVTEFKNQGVTQAEAEEIVFQAEVKSGAWGNHDK
jgi:hypothetical protein